MNRDKFPGLANAAIAIDDIRLFLPMDPAAIQEWNQEIERRSLSKRRTFMSRRGESLGMAYCAANRDGTAIVIDGNPQSNESGQNVQPSLRTRDLVEVFVRNVILDHVPHLHSAVTEAAIRNRQLKVTRIALAMDLVLASAEDGPALITAVDQVFRYVSPIAKGNVWHNGGLDESAYYRPNSRRWSLTVYLKGPEVTAKWGDKHRFLPQEGKLRTLAQRLVRFELVLRWAELKRLGLQDWSAWDRNTPRVLMGEYLGRAKLHGEVAIGGKLPASFTTQQSLAYAAYMNGVNVRSILPEGTYRKYVTVFREHGLSLRMAPPRPRQIRVDSLIRKCVRHGVSRWAKSAGLFGYWRDPRYLLRVRTRSARLATEFEWRKQTGRHS